jgi:rod shape-determining protein MreB and related proteins
MSDIAIDLGTANTLIHVKGKGLVFNEATAIAFDEITNAVISFGNNAAEMVGRTPPSIRVVRPLSTGVVSDFAAARMYLQLAIRKVVRYNRWSPLRVVIGVPSRISGAEFKTFQDALDSTKISKIWAVQEPVAAAIGSGLNFGLPKGCLVIDIGAGTTDLAMLSLGRVVDSRSIRIGAEALTAAFTNYLKNERRINVGDKTAEDFLHAHAQAKIISQANGRINAVDMKTGLPVKVDITAAEVYGAIKEPVSLIIGELRRLLDSVPPDLASDILNEGIHLTGGGSLLKGLPELLKEQTGLNCAHVEDPLQAVVNGCGQILDDLDAYKFVLESMPDEIRNSAI